MSAWTQQHRRALVAVVALAVLGAGAILTLSRPSPPEAKEEAPSLSERIEPARLTPPRSIVSAASPAPPSAPATSAEPSGEAPSVDRVAALRRGLASEDVADRIAAIEAVVSVTAVEALDELARFNLPGDPAVAPTVIHAVALLGASADDDKRDEAAKTLDGWLRKEVAREGADARGNTSNLVEALGNVGGRDAVEALAAALDRQELPLHMETLAVIKLGELGDPAGRGAVERFAARIAELPPAEGLEEELRAEAVEAARTTLMKL